MNSTPAIIDRTSSDRPVVVVGAGLSGLIAATALARDGRPVVLLEKARSAGGRAATVTRDGYVLNLGPHALYRAGHLSQTLGALGVDVHGAVPSANGAFALHSGRTYTLPVGLTSLMTTGLLGLREKKEFAQFNARLASLNASAIQNETLTSWLNRHIHHEHVRELIKMYVRVASFTNDADHQSAGAALAQLQLALEGVLYLDGGWQTLVDGLHQKAIEAGVGIRVETSAVSIERGDRGDAEAVRLSNGDTIAASAVIIAAAPPDVDMLTGVTHLASTTPAPVRVATLDVGVRALPNPTRTLAFGVDRPLYFSVHSATARLAPAGGGLIHAARYLEPAERVDSKTESELEALLDLMQPGWRDKLVVSRYLPNLVVTHAQVTAAQGGLSGRPFSTIPKIGNVFVAGDWVGPRGQLSDAAAASAIEAARFAAAASNRRAA